MALVSRVAPDQIAKNFESPLSRANSGKVSIWTGILENFGNFSRVFSRLALHVRPLFRVRLVQKANRDCPLVVGLDAEISGAVIPKIPHQFFFLTPRGTDHPSLDFSGHCKLSFSCLVSFIYATNPANGIRFIRSAASMLSRSPWSRPEMVVLRINVFNLAVDRHFHVCGPHTFALPTIFTYGNLWQQQYSMENKYL